MLRNSLRPIPSSRDHALVADMLIINLANLYWFGGTAGPNEHAGTFTQQAP